MISWLHAQAFMCHKSIVFSIFTFACLCGFILINAGPVYFPDSAGILNAGLQSLKAAGLTSHAPDIAAQLGHPPAAFAGSDDGYVVAGRSAYLGIAMVGAGHLLGPAGYALLLAVLTTFLIVFTLDRFGWPEGASRFRLVLALTLATPLSFFIAVLLADHLFSLMILAVALLTIETRVRQMALLGTIIALTLLAHYGALMLLLLIGPAALMFRRWHGRPVRPALLAFATAVAVGVGGQLLFVAAVQAKMGRAPVTIPTVLARLIEDGPASDILREACARDPNRWFTCRFADRLPMSEETFLWVRDPAVGAYGSLPPALKAKISAEEGSIVLAAIKSDPLKTFRSSMGHVVQQAVLVDIRDFGLVASLARQMPYQHNPFVRADYRSLVDTAPHWAALASILYLLVFLISVVTALAVLILRRRSLPHDQRDFAAMILIALLASAALHATVVGPYPRYQTRVAWLATLAAVILIGGLRDRPASRPARRSDRLPLAPAP